MAQLYKGPGPSGAPQQEGSNMQQPFNGGGMMPNNGMQPNQGRPPSHLQIKQQGPMPPPSPAQSKPQNTSLNSHPNGAIKQEGVKQEGMNQQVPNASSSADGSHGSPQNTNSSNAGNGGQNNAANSGGGTTGHPNNGRATPASAPPFVTASPAARPPTTDHTVPRPPTAPVVESLQVPPILSGPPSENIFSADQFAMLGGLDTFPEDFNSFSDINFDRDFDQWLNKEP
ncbi:hypothetical protein SISNIDRAFT_29581 [Sistotremastrum niveocremeum HHB9708]|nr:hypothetical protein SISNIDRAFT_29581 [Sistotremastrum niveocremeum HHB9708]